MITLLDIFQDLEDGELNQFSITGEIDGIKGITPKDYPMLIRLINLGLTDMHTQLNLKEREVIINLFDGQYRYNIDSRYSIHAVTEREYNPKFIQDPPDVAYRFKDDIIQIRAAYDELGNELTLNNVDDPRSVFIVNHNTIQYCGACGDAILLVYQANHPKIPTDADLHTELSIPENMRELLYTYIVYRVLLRSQGQDQFSVAQAYKAKYDQMVLNFKRLNTLNTQDSTPAVKFKTKGWI